jgi:hypothetical protein
MPKITPAIVRALSPPGTRPAVIATKATRWRRELPEHVGLALRLADEVAGHTGESAEAVLARIISTTPAHKPTDPASSPRAAPSSPR